MTQAEAAEKLKTAFSAFYAGKVYYEPPPLNTIKTDIFVRNYQRPGPAERINIGKPVKVRQSVSNMFEIWTQAAAGPNKHFDLHEQIIQFIYKTEVQGLGLIEDPSLLQSYAPASATDWVFSVIEQNYYFDKDFQSQ